MRNNLRAAIVQRYGSQEDFSAVVRIHPVRLSRLCRGRVEPTSIERERISRELNGDPDWLFSTLTVIPPLPVAPVSTD